MIALVVLAILAALILAFTQLKSFLFKAKDATLTKEGQKLQTEADAIKVNIVSLKEEQNKPTEALSPEAVENYWSKK